MTDILNFISGKQSKLQLALNAILKDDVASLQSVLEDSQILEITNLPNSPKENLLTHAINRNAEKCCTYLIQKLHWSCINNLDTFFCPLFLCFIQCYFPVCYEVFKTVNINFDEIIRNAPKNASDFQILRNLIWPIKYHMIEATEGLGSIELQEELDLANKKSFGVMHSLLVLSRAMIRRLIQNWIAENNEKKQSTPNYFYVINQLNLPDRLVFFLAYSEMWPIWNKSETKPYRGRPRIPEYVLYFNSNF